MASQPSRTKSSTNIMASIRVNVKEGVGDDRELTYETDSGAYLANVLLQTDIDKVESWENFFQDQGK